MNKMVAAVKSTFAFGFVGAFLGALASYVLEFWGTHALTLQSILDGRMPAIGWTIISSNIYAGFFFALPAAFLAGLLLSATAMLIARRFARFYPYFWPALGASTGCLAAFILYGAQYPLGWPITSALVAGGLAALLLARRLRTWLCPTVHSTGPARNGAQVG